MTEHAPDTWEDVARKHGRKIYNFAYRLCGNADDASDLVQEVLLRVNRSLSTYTPGSFDGWLWRITRNAFIDDVRRRQRRPTVPLPDQPDRMANWSAPDPDSVLASIQLGEDVQKALLDIPYEFREAVVMCDVLGFTYEEIASAVESPIGTVRSRIHRGRKLLRERLS
jgi:RNA polymerase sigma-70 factor (ECF subfamily)